jgi:signal transduction histidine kinase
VDRSQFGQILVNLASNAIHAMEPGGVLTISTGRRDDEVYVEMRDTGPGIAPEHLGRIFEPFFSTKPSSRGTGLGLAVCRTLIAQLHGRITVESMLGGGSVFTVWLPPVLALEGQRA